MITTLPLLAAYAEAHYTRGALRGAYWRPQPEILADLPHRCTTPRLPVAILIKDAHRWPVKLLAAEVRVHAAEGVQTHRFPLDEPVREPWFSRVLHVPLDGLAPEQPLHVNVRIVTELGGRQITFINDNYHGLPWEPFLCYSAAQRPPFPADWHLGDAHYHSSYTADQVEFGAQPAVAAQMARALGLDWFFVTDHSYDLDDCEDNYLRPDPALPKWHAMRAACAAADRPDLRVLAGEEISIGNGHGQNVHLLAVGDPAFHPGDGDSAERWFRNRPTAALANLAIRPDALYIPAHPFDPVPPLQRLTLRRGAWSAQDYRTLGARWIQGINGGSMAHVRQCARGWRDLLLAGHRLLLCAGNDAHGNFGCMRQIRTPMLRLFRARAQVVGHWFRAFRHERNEPQDGFRRGELVVSNGPFVSMALEADGVRTPIGGAVGARAQRLRLEFATAPQWGPVESVWLHVGDVRQQKETTLTARDGMDIVLPEHGYARVELRTKNGGLAITNPIFAPEEQQ